MQATGNYIKYGGGGWKVKHSEEILTLQVDV
jgi:hypothetical protein